MIVAIFKKWRNRRAAERYGVPFEDKDFWPPFYLMAHEGKMPNFPRVTKILTRLEWEPQIRSVVGKQPPTLYKARTGDVVPILLTDDGLVHFYTLRGKGRIPGGDHIVSPERFSIEYHSTVAAADLVAEDAA